MFSLNHDLRKKSKNVEQKENVEEQENVETMVAD